MNKINELTNPKTNILLVLIIVLGTILRFYQLDTYSIFFDEKSTMVVSQGIVLEGANQKDVFSKPTFTPREFWAPKSFADYCEAMTRSDIGNSPFYYLLLHWWMDVFGYSDFSARAMSALFSVLIIGLTFVFTRRFFGNKTAIIATFIVAIEPFFIAYSHQARNYSLTFFLTLLSTYFFLRLIENEQKRKNDWLLYLGYSLVSGLCLLSHFLTISVFLAHGIYALIFLRNLQGWKRIIIAGIVASLGLVWWMTMGGGQWTLRTLAYQANLYRELAHTNPDSNPYAHILPATIPNVALKSFPIFTDIYILTNGLADTIGGKIEYLVSILTGLVLIGVYYGSQRIALLRKLGLALPTIILLGSVLFYKQNHLQLMIFSAGIFTISLLPQIHQQADSQQRKRLWLLYIVGLVPTLFIIIMSFKNGHTYGLTQRYSGFSFPYIIILVALVLQHIAKLEANFKVPISILLLAQLGFVGNRLQEIYADKSLKYTYFIEPRQPNPYYIAANKIKELYQPGDTIFYPAPKMVFLTEMDRTFLPYSIQDAQLTNLYLPKEADYVQAMDTTQFDRIILKRKISGDSLELVNLNGRRQ